MLGLRMVCITTIIVITKDNKLHKEKRFARKLCHDVKHNTLEPTKTT